MTPEGVAAEVIGQHYPCPCGRNQLGFPHCVCGWEPPDDASVLWRHHAAEVMLAALRTGGYAATRLPEPLLGPDKDGHVEFGDGSEAGSATTSIGAGVVWSDGWEWSADEARSVAAVWLAAAAVAEQTGKQS